MRIFPTASDLAGVIDHTRLAPDTTRSEIRRLCEEARRYGFAAVCVPPCYVGAAAGWLDGSTVAVGTVIGFPLGHHVPSVKVAEAAEAVRAGAAELDLMIHPGTVKMKGAAAVRREVAAVRKAASPALLRVILETGCLTRDEKVSACRWIRAAGVVWVKTASGFGPRGTTAADVRLLRRAVGRDGLVKAAGGIRDLAAAEAMIKAGASRIGTRCGAEILKEYFSRYGPA